MKLQQIEIENFRSIRKQTVSFGQYSALVGPNGSGKSAVLMALNVFFRNAAATTLNMNVLSKEDFHNKDTANPIAITLTFSDLSAAAQEDFKLYYRQGKLVVRAKAIWNESSHAAEVVQYGLREVMPDFLPVFNDKEKLSAEQIKSLYKVLREKYTDLPAESTATRIREHLRAYEEAHSALCELREESNQFYGWSKGTSLLEKHFQWIYVPAVKDVASEQEESSGTALGQIIQRTVRARVKFDDALAALETSAKAKYAEIVGAEAQALNELSESLTARLREWTHEGTSIKVEWNIEDAKAVKVTPPKAKLSAGEGGFVGELPRLGHGLQRTILVSLLQELVEVEDGTGPTLFLAIEEPELYQHPPQARHMSEILSELSTKGSQIAITTHSPYFVSAEKYEDIRYVRKSGQPGQTAITATDNAQIAAEVAAALGEAPQKEDAFVATVNQIMLPAQNELFFCSFAVIVEGPEDVALISAHLKLANRWAHFRSKGGHFVISIGKNNMSRIVAIAKKMAIPYVAVFDCDSNCKDEAKAQNQKANTCLFKLAGLPGQAPFPATTIADANVVAWPATIQKSIEGDYGADIWKDAQAEAKKRLGLDSGKHEKNPACIAGALEALYGKVKPSTELKKVEERIFALIG